MAEVVRAITWEAPEHAHAKKGSDWFWILGIAVFSIAIVAILFGNILFAILVLIGGAVMAMVVNRDPALIQYAVTTRGLRVGDQLYPFSTIEAFYIDEENPTGPQLLARSEKMFMHLIVMPLPPDHLAEIDTLLESKLPEEFMEEPLGTKILEFFGF